MNFEQLIKLNEKRIYRELDKIAIDKSLKSNLISRIEELKSNLISRIEKLEYKRYESEHEIYELEEKNIELQDINFENELKNVYLRDRNCNLLLKNEDLEWKVHKLTEENENLKDINDKLYDKNGDLEVDVKFLRHTNSSNTLEIVSFLTSYENIKRRYDINNVPYKMTSEEDLTKIFGFKFEDIKGFNDLTKEDREVVFCGILNFLNENSLGNRAQNIPIEIYKEGEEFRFLTVEDNYQEVFMDKEGKVYK